jgi:hypothetical protein
MKFEIYGGFEIKRDDETRQGVFNRSFWDVVRDADPRLTDACGCYLFALQNGRNIVAWYVGKAERQSFYQECFLPAKRYIYNDVLARRSGKPLLFLIARVTPGGKFCKPATGHYPDVDFLENMLIGFALNKNPDLKNIGRTRMLREMVVPGVINSPRAAPRLPVRELKNALGLD